MISCSANRTTTRHTGAPSTTKPPHPAHVAQSVEQRPVKPLVAGSIPAGGADETAGEPAHPSHASESRRGTSARGTKVSLPCRGSRSTTASSEGAGQSTAAVAVTHAPASARAGERSDSGVPMGEVSGLVSGSASERSRGLVNLEAWDAMPEFQVSPTGESQARRIALLLWHCGNAYGSEAQS